MSERLILERDRAQIALSQGARTMTALLRPTLGPLARTVAISGVLGNTTPEILDSGATIARRTVQLEDAFADMGAMVIRNLAWSQFEATGDFTVTACVVAQALVDSVLPYVAAGGDPLSVASAWSRALEVVINELRAQSMDITSSRDLKALAVGLLRERELAEMIADVLDAVGPDGPVTIEDSASTDSGYSFLEGITWPEGWASSALAKNDAASVELNTPVVFVSEQPIESGNDVLPILEHCLASGVKSLFIIAPHVGNGALQLLLLNRDRGVFGQIGAVSAPFTGPQQRQVLIDIAVLTGGKSVNRAAWTAGDSVQPDDFGRAQRVRISRQDFCILGGAGARSDIRQRLLSAKRELRSQSSEVDEQPIRARIGRLGGVAAVVRIGAATKIAQVEKRHRVEAAVRSARSAMTGGVVAGGGGALARSALAVDGSGRNEAECAAFRGLAHALREPMRTISDNAGLSGNLTVHLLDSQPPNWTFDVCRRTWETSQTLGILDSSTSLVSALEKAVSAASMLLTTGTLVRHRVPTIAAEP